MKEQYFSADSIDRHALSMQKDLSMFHAGHPFNFEPERSALIILDMQRYFLDPASHAFIPSAPPIVPRLMELIEAYMQLDLPVLFTRHVNTRENAGSMDTWWKDLIISEDPMSALIPELEELEPIILDKEQYDAFYRTDLEDWLRENDISQVVIGGVMTHLCCESTARSAFVRGFEVFFLIDGTATYTIDFHRSTLLTLSHGFAVPIRIEQVMKRLSTLFAGIDGTDNDDEDDGDEGDGPGIIGAGEDRTGNVDLGPEDIVEDNDDEPGDDDDNDDPFDDEEEDWEDDPIDDEDE